MKTNLSLTPLERKIKLSALETIRSIGKEIPESSASMIVFASYRDGIYDQLYYDNINKRFSHVEYVVNKSKGFVFKKLML